MPIPRKYLAGFREHGVYHVFNRTNNKEKLFLSDENRRFFLRKYNEHLSSYLDTNCWCLLSNHFHFLIRIKPHAVITDTLSKKDFTDRSLTENKFLEKVCGISEWMEHAFKRFFQSCSLAFNKVHQRQGNLFYKPFKRVEVNQDSHLTQAVLYIHTNPVKHGVLKDFAGYEWSSWHDYLSEAPSWLLRDEVIGWFVNKEQFIKAHTEFSQARFESVISIED